jgi:hypothetical protein
MTGRPGPAVLLGRYATIIELAQMLRLGASGSGFSNGGIFLQMPSVEKYTFEADIPYA